MATQDGDLPLPPPQGTPIDDPSWQEWFLEVFNAVGRDGTRASSLGIRGPTRQVTFTGEFDFQELATVNAGLYSNYTSSNGNPIYGFASNVRRSAGNAATSGGQFNGWGGKQLSGAVVGSGGAAIGEDGFQGVLIALNAAVVNQTRDNIASKVGGLFNFSNRFGATVSGLGANQYNYYSHAMRVVSQPRSSVGEFCGWSVGLQFLSDSLDATTPRAWSAVITYSSGEVVSSGGLAWKAIQPSLNQVPAAVSAYWVQHTYAGAACLAIGIDFSCLSVQTMTRMSAAMRLRDGMAIQWEVTGAISTLFDVGAVPNPRWVIRNQGVERLGFDTTNGDIYKNGVFLI